MCVCVCVGGAEAGAKPGQSNRFHLVSHRGQQRARVGQVAWVCVGGAEARAKPGQSNRVQLVSHRGYLWVRLPGDVCVCVCVGGDSKRKHPLADERISIGPEGKITECALHH